MLEQYLCMSSIAEAHSHSCIPLEVEMHCFGRAFTENNAGLRQGSKAQRLPVKPGLSGCQVFALFQLRNNSASQTLNAIVYFPL